jgi:predicted dehydrogenase
LENSGRFEVVGVYDPSPEAVKSAADKFNVTSVYSSAEEMLKKTKPEVLVFVTHPNIRKEYIELGVKYGVKSIVFEKPMAVFLADAREITRLCVDNGIKAVVSHQQKYLKQMREFYTVVRSGVLGQIDLIRISTRYWASQLATHFIDYALWANGGTGAEWVVGHVNGRNKLTNGHPSPDYIMGEARLKNGVTLLIECGYLSPITIPGEHDSVLNRITVFGSHGYAWAETAGRCGFLSGATQGKAVVAQHAAWSIQEHEIQTPFYTDLADWLDDDKKKHPCNVEISLHGFEIMEGLYKSALENIRVDLPIQGAVTDAIEEMKKILPEQTYPEKS